MRVETHLNGGASVVYLHQNDVDMLGPTQQEALAKEFLKVLKIVPLTQPGHGQSVCPIFLFLKTV